MPKTRRLWEQDDLAGVFALVHAAVRRRRIPQQKGTVRHVPQDKKHDGRDQVAGRGEGIHKIPTVVIRARIQEGFPPSPPASGWTIQAQPGFTKPNCELYRTLNN